MSKINYLFSFMLIIMSVSVYADFETVYEPVDNNINFDLNEFAEFRLTVRNTGTASDRYIIFSCELCQF